MMTIWIYVALVILALAVLNWVPGIKLLVGPVIQLVTKLVEEIFKHSISYIVWLSKLIVSSHVELFRHMTHHRTHFNPADEMDD